MKAVADELSTVSTHKHLILPPVILISQHQGNVDKVVVLVKNKEDIALERFVFAVQNMIQVESYNKDTRFVVYVMNVQHHTGISPA